MTYHLRRWASLAVWVAAATAALALWVQTEGRDALPAQVEIERHLVGSLEAARLRAVFVRSGDPVAAGQSVASLDTSDLDAELVVARGRLEERLAETDAETDAFARTTRERRIELQGRLASARAEVATQHTRNAARRAELKTLGSELKRLDGVVNSGLAELDRLSDLRARQERLSREARHAPKALDAYRQIAQRMGEALDAIGDADLAVRVRPVRARAETQARRIDELLARRARRVLVAPVDGHVTRILHGAGDAVGASDPVLEIVASRAGRLVAYMPEGAARRLKPGAPIEARARDRSVTATAQGVVERLGPGIVELPPRFWPRPTTPVFGRAVHIRLARNAQLLPGEAATVVALKGAAVAAPALMDGTLPASVPPELAALTRVEPSGAVWLPERGRFLVVSDDTGIEDRNEHVPWALTATADGQFDAAPLVIDGAGSISDLEAVALGPDGSLYLLCSQSQSRKGKRPRKRQRFIRARLDGPRLKVTGQIELYSALVAALDTEKLQRLGVGASLDIEGMTWHDGGLLIGLKAPTNRRGRAALWHLTRPDALFDGPGLVSGGAEVRPFRGLDLPTGRSGAMGGVSDLLAEGETLYLLSTLADGPDAGAAWRLDLSKPHAQPERLATWDGLKPEALGRAPKGALVVFFDRGDDAPRYTRLATDP